MSDEKREQEIRQRLDASEHHPEDAPTNDAVICNAWVDIRYLLTALERERGERQRLQKRIDQLEADSACAADRANSWCRESSVPELKDHLAPFALRDAIDRLWGKTSGELSALRARAEAAEADGAGLGAVVEAAKLWKHTRDIFRTSRGGTNGEMLAAYDASEDAERGLVAALTALTPEANKETKK